MPEALEAALLVALAARCAGRPVGESSVREALEALGIPPPDPWMLEALCRLAGPARRPEPEDRAAGRDGELARPGEPEAAPAALGEPAGGLYLYALAPADRLGQLSCPGVDGLPVEVVTAGEWAAVVHRCPGRPYASERREQLVEWVQQHHEVVEQAARLAGDVIPVAFNTVVFRRGQEPLETLAQWLMSHEQELRSVLQRIGGCLEFGVQLLRDPLKAEEAALAQREELQRLRHQASASPPGTAYLREQELRQQLRQAVQEEAASRARQLEQQLRAWCRELRQERLRAVGEGLEMVAHFSCLVPRPSARAFVDALHGMELPPGYSVRLSGPWPPYSFVSLRAAGEEEER